MKIKLFVLLIVLSFGAKQSTNIAELEPILVKIEEDEYAKVHKKESYSQFIGVSYMNHAKSRKWFAQRRNKHEKKMMYNGCYDNERAAAHASDTLARKWMANGEQGYKLNFPDDDTEVFPEKKRTSSQYIGVSYDAVSIKWQAKRHSRHKKTMIHNGRFDNEETAARASDTLARKLLENGEEGHKLNFPDDDTEMFPKEKKTSSQYIGVHYYVKRLKWHVQRHSKHEKKNVSNGYYDNEEAAAHASDILATTLKTKGEQGHKMNFPDNETEEFPEQLQRKRKRPYYDDLDHPKNY